MTSATQASPSPSGATARVAPAVRTLREHTIEIVSDSGEGAQKCGQVFGAVSAKMGNGVWTVEIIPAEIQPPPRIPEGASGNRIRVGTSPVTNWGDETNLIVAFNEQVLLARHRPARWQPTPRSCSITGGRRTTIRTSAMPGTRGSPNWAKETTASSRFRWRYSA